MLGLHSVLVRHGPCWASNGANPANPTTAAGHRCRQPRRPEAGQQHSAASSAGQVRGCGSSTLQAGFAACSTPRRLARARLVLTPRAGRPAPSLLPFPQTRPRGRSARSTPRPSSRSSAPPSRGWSCSCASPPSAAPARCAPSACARISGGRRAVDSSQGAASRPVWPLPLPSGAPRPRRPPLKLGRPTRGAVSQRGRRSAGSRG